MRQTTPEKHKRKYEGTRWNKRHENTKGQFITGKKKKRTKGQLMIKMKKANDKEKAEDTYIEKRLNEVDRYVMSKHQTEHSW